MTDRTIRSTEDVDRLRFTSSASTSSPSAGDASHEDPSPAVVPVVAQDADSGEVLMLAYADREALAISLETGGMHFWSRSRAELWRKGATSGNTLEVVSLHADCDGDAVLARVRPAGPVCHTGEVTCFGDTPPPKSPVSRGRVTQRVDGGPVDDSGSAHQTPGNAHQGVLQRLDEVLASRARERPEGSYTARLLGDPNLRLKKIGEEGAELVAALSSGDSARAVEETADVWYHSLVALRAAGVGVDAVLAALAARAR